MYRVLIVDDEQIVRIALKSTIDWEKYNFYIIGSAGDGISAISMVERMNPDIIITDLKMPKLDGIGLIKSLKENGYTGKIVVLSNYGEYELVREAMRLGASDYLLKLTLRSEELLQILLRLSQEIDEVRERDRKQHIEDAGVRESRMVLRSNFFRELLAGNFTDLGQAIEKANELEINYEEGSYFMVYISIDNINDIISTAMIDDMKLLILSVTNITSEIFGSLKGAEVIEAGSGKFAAIIPSSDTADLEDKIYQACTKVLRSIQTYLNISVNMVMGTWFTGLSEMKALFDECMECSEVRFYKGDGFIIKLLEEKDKFTQPTWGGLVLKTASEVRDYIESGKVNDACALIAGILDDAIREYVAPDIVKRLVRMIVEDVGKLLVEWKPDGSFIFGEIEEEILKAETVENLRSLIFKYLKDLWAELEKAKEQKYRREISIIINYIEKNYDKRINLDMCARQVNMNKSYICRIFKEETNKTFVDYLNDIRMKKAYDLLKQADKTVKEVASAVGISDQFYFSRVFSKYYGISPTEFKKKTS